jgi:ATP-dependent protease ClpP protease subunit
MNVTNSTQSILLDGEVNQSLYYEVEKFLQDLVDAGSPSATININLLGGDTLTGLTIFQMLREYGGHVTGKVFQRCESSAVVILQGCDTRIAYPSSEFLIHHARNFAGFDSGMFHEDLSLNERGKQKAQQLLAARDETLKALLYRASLVGTSREQLLEVFERDENILATEALKLGLIDQITSCLDTPFASKQQ